MSDGPLSEVPIGKIENATQQVGVLSREERQRITESLHDRGIFFGIYPTEGGRDTTRLEPFRDRIESVGLTAVAEVAKEMPIGNVSIGVFDVPELAIPEYGIGGRAHGRTGDDPTSLIELDLDPESPHKETAIGEDLRKTIRHESHHDKRFDALGQTNIRTLLDALILEGLATHYEIEGSDEEPSLYATAVTLEQIPALLARAKDEFSSEDPRVVQEWLFGSEEKNIPRWAGYAIGHHLVGEYLKTHPDKKASTLYATPAEEFIEPLSEMPKFSNK